jgi:transcriptional regulator with XRE-family HTH domain
MTNIAAVLRGIRAKFNLTQEQLAERLGVSFATVNRWEGAANEPQRAARDAILRLAEEAGVDAATGEPLPTMAGRAGTLARDTGDGREPQRRNSVTTRSTGGPGFDFEDRVAAWFLLRMLLGEPVPGIDGTGISLRMQTGALGWLIDDLLVTSVLPPGEQRELAISCKSNVQVSTNGLPGSFVEDAWKQWWGIGTGPMRADDCLMLVTRGRHPAFLATWSDIKDWSGGEPALALARILAPEKHRQIFNSVKDRATNLGRSVSDVEALELIRRIEVLPLDLRLATSQDEQHAIGQCRGLLRNSTLAEGRALWTALVDRARDARIGDGTITLAALWRELRVRFPLRDHPDFLPSWDRLRALTADYIATIEIALPSGYKAERKRQRDELKAALRTRAACALYGESGTGKSALLKDVLDADFPEALQVWLGPGTLAAALSEIERGQLGLGHPLLEILDGAAGPYNLLVIDAAERLPKDVSLKAQSLIAELLQRNVNEKEAGWRVIIVGQTEAWADGRLQLLAGSEQPPSVEMTDLADEETKAALRSTGRLRWLAQHDEAVSVLGNPRTLAWVMQAEGRFQQQEPAVFSLPMIADRLWSFWTQDKASIQRLMMRLGEREASFEHSFALSELEGDEAQAFEIRTNQCPLRLNPRNRIQFQHDLASEWARFQRLKEIADDTARWAVLATNPLWNGALRMLGQLLLREQRGEVNAWDAALAEAQQIKDKAPLADDILLDALFLDPNAEAFLDERAELLFANNAALLGRLLLRFEHIASVPGVSPAANVSSLTRLYFEAKFRTPILGRWPAIAKFLAKHRERISGLILPVVSRLAERWLTSLPLTMGNGEPVPFRKEFAWLAVDGARALQLGQAKRIIFLGDFEEPVYSAAFSAARDLPDEVSEWALEVAQRRELRSDIAEKLKAHRDKEAKKHRRRLATDEEYRELHERRGRAPFSMIGAGRRLPPWPLGPQRSIERDFHKICLHSPALYGLMQVRPAVAAEVLLACIIEDSPEERYSHHLSIDRAFGLEYDGDGYPTAYWKSPFFGFLRANPDIALGTLFKLVNFCTERWEVESEREHRQIPSSMAVTLSSGVAHEFKGDFGLFKMSQTDSHHTGQLSSALAALEQWLRTLLDAELDITPYIENILVNSNSVAMLGVLINLGKHKPELFKGPLKSLVGIHLLYLWDDARVEQSPSRWFDAFSWSREGETMFNAAREWARAPYRQIGLREVVSDLVSRDPLFGADVLPATAEWTSPSTEKEALEFRILIAQLDYRNYRSVTPAAGQDETIEFQPPADIVRDARLFQQQTRSALLTLRLPDACQQVLSTPGALSDASAAELANAMTLVASDDASDLSHDMKARGRVAAAAALLRKASPDWLAGNPAFEAEARRIVNEVISGIGDTLRDIQARHMSGRGELQFIAHVVARDWISQSTPDTDKAVLRLVTSGDWDAMQSLVSIVYLARDELGGRWWRLLFLALLWSGLSVVVPRFDDREVVGRRWSRWLRWLRTRRLSVATTADTIEPLSIAERVERIERDRWSRHRHFEIEPGRLVSAGLEPYYVKAAFAWLLGNRSSFTSDSAEFREAKNLILGLWAYEGWRLVGRVKDDGDYDLLSQQLGYDLVGALAHMVLNGPIDTSSEFWNPVLKLGPKGHYAISHFFTEWFNKLTDQTNVEDFGKRWRPMVEYVHRASDWREGPQWYHAEQLERQVLGFGAESYIARAPEFPALIGGMRDLYRNWAETRLSGSEDNLAGFCNFLASRVGRPLRLDGLLWISEAVKNTPHAAHWHRDSSLDALISFLNLLLSEHAQEISKDEDRRQALFDLAAYVVSRNHPSGLALQERIRRMV